MSELTGCVTSRQVALKGLGFGFVGLLVACVKAPQSQTHYTAPPSQASASHTTTESTQAASASVSSALEPTPALPSHSCAAEVLENQPFQVQLSRQGIASYYHDSLSGNRTASGEVYDPRACTAAHRSLPFGTLVRVERVDTGQSTVVRINDRGPFGRKHRLIDLSRRAAEELAMTQRGVAEVRLQAMRPRKKNP